MSLTAFVSYRLSIRWLPNEPSEPTNTIVLTSARNGIFLDVRFLKETRELDWAFAGFRSEASDDERNVIIFKHCIDSRTLDIVEDSGRNTTLPDGTVLEEGEMVNPRTGEITSYEELWKDNEEMDPGVLFVKNLKGSKWQARVGRWQIGMGRGEDGMFYAWRAEKTEDGSWKIQSSTRGNAGIAWLPEESNSNWREGTVVQWQGDQWNILEVGDGVMGSAPNPLIE